MAACVMIVNTFVLETREKDDNKTQCLKEDNIMHIII